MKKITTLSTIALSTLLLITAANAKTDTTAEMKHEANHNEHAKHWGYMGDVAPRHWGELNTKYKMCAHGKQQTPINIVPSKDVDLKPLDLQYKADAKSIINNGHTIQVNVAEGSVLKIDGADYKLKQFHFHVPSENNIKGDSFPLEAHFVHATDDGQLAVVAVMFKEGAANASLAKVWKQFPNLKVGKALPFSLSLDEIKALMPENKDYYKFMGSLTTPPCSENVKWHVLKTPLTMSKEQINAFFSQFGFPNNRPIQNTNNRTIEE